MYAIRSYYDIVCPNCGKLNFTDIRQFNLMFKTFQGVTEDTKSELFLRPETAQGIFVNFANIQRTSRKKVPFGVAQIGKSVITSYSIHYTKLYDQSRLTTIK